jgi:hypothetical protein
LLFQTTNTVTLPVLSTSWLSLPRRMVLFKCIETHIGLIDGGPPYVHTY